MDLCRKVIFRSITIIVITAATLFAEEAHQKILIMTPTSNHPEFIAMQAQAFKKFIKDDYEFVVFNDAFDDAGAKEIFDMCSSLNIPCTRVPQENRPIGKGFAWATYRHAQAMQFMMETTGFGYNGIVVLIDSDLFPINNFSVTEFLDGYDIAGLRQGIHESKTEYLWPGLMFLRMNTLPNKETMSFNPEETETVKVDSAGSLYHYFQENPSVKKLFFKQDARLRLDDNLQPFYFYVCPFKSVDLHCSGCSKNKKTDTTKKCTHKKALLEELGFRKEIINLILQGKIPSQCDFQLGDTFFHLGAGSGYAKNSNDIMRYKLMVDFMDLMLSPF